MFETKLIERDFSFRPRKKKVQFSRLSQLTMVAAGLGISLGLLGGTSTSSQTNAATQATVTQQQIAIALPSISDTAPPATDTPIVLAKADIASNANIVEHKDAIAEIAIKAEQQELQSQPVQQDNDVIIEVAKAHELEEAVRAAEAFAAATQNQSKSAESIATEWKTVKVLKGDTVAAIFQRHGYSQKDLHNIVNTNSAGKSLAKVHPGDEILFLVDADNKIQSISHEIDSTNSLNITRVGKKWDAKIV